MFLNFKCPAYFICKSSNTQSMQYETISKWYMHSKLLLFNDANHLNKLKREHGEFLLGC